MKLSGGQRQRIAIARVILTNPEILVLEDGEIVERGAHEQLLQTDGLYANLWKVQAGEVDYLPEEFVDRVARSD